MGRSDQSKAQANLDFAFMDYREDLAGSALTEVMFSARVATQAIPVVHLFPLRNSSTHSRRAGSWWGRINLRGSTRRPC